MGSPNEFSFSIIDKVCDNAAACAINEDIVYLNTIVNKNKLLPVWKISLVTILITGARTIHWSWEQSMCIVK